MSTKAEALREKMRKKPAKPAVKPVPETPKPPRKRQCCDTFKGKDLPHLPECRTLVRALPRNIKMSRRLPDRSTFFGAYDASILRWTVTLTVLTENGDVTFTTDAGGIFNAMRKLDVLYRKYAAEQKNGIGTPK